MAEFWGVPGHVHDHVCSASQLSQSTSDGAQTCICLANLLVRFVPINQAAVCCATQRLSYATDWCSNILLPGGFQS